jgi:hypothetical protein
VPDSSDIQKRLELIRRLNNLPTAQLGQLIFILNPPVGNIPPQSAAPSARVEALLEWAKHPASGCGLEVVEAVLEKLEKEISPNTFSGRIPSKAETSFLKLKNYLKIRDWRSADSETSKLIFMILGKDPGKRLAISDLLNLPCSELTEIDLLWLQYSDHQFGFSIQRKIWETLEKPTTYTDWGKFGQKVGWRKQKSFFSKAAWIEPEELLFNGKAPKGHLPSFGLSLDFTIDSTALCSVLFSHMTECLQI